MPDPKKKPIIVNSKNDPRYKAYQDSLVAYSRDTAFDKELIEIVKRKGTITEKERQQLDKKYPLNNVKPKKEYGLNKAPILFTGDKGYKVKDLMVFKKPQQPVIVQDIRKPNTTTGQQVKEDNNKGMVFNETLIRPREKQTPLQQIQTKGLIESNQEINTPLATVRPQAQMPKSWNVTDTNNQRFGGTETNYKLYPDTLNTIRELPKEGWDRKITPQYAMGGQLNNNNMQNNNLTRFDEGGLHHQNPLGGIPVGGNNTVEQGETKLKNYVYSNRIAIDENMTKEMNLPSYIKGKTFADASKAIDNKFKDRNDKHSLETKNVFLDRLKQAQETVKQQEQQRAEQIAQSMQSNQQEVPDMMNGEVPEGMEQFTEQNQMFMGGDFNIAEVGNITGGLAGLAGKASPYLGAAATGAQAGSMFGPIGTGVGAAIGLGSSIIGANKAKKQQVTDLRNNANAANLTDNFAYGGSIKKFDGGGDLNEGTISDEDITNNLAYQFQRRSNNRFINAQNILGVKPDGDFGKISQNALKTYQANKGLSVDGKLGPDTYKEMGLNNRGVLPLETLKPVGTNVLKTNINTPLANIPTNSIISGQNNKLTENSENSEGNWLDRNGGKILKYAPIAANALQLANLKKPAYTRLDRLTNRFKPEYVDEQSLQNIANSEMNNSINSISQIGGSQGAVRNAILGAGLNKTKALGNAYMDASAQNRQTNMAAQQFNLGVDQTNINQANQELDINDKNQAAYRNEKSKYIASIGTDLGSIGKEEVNKNQIADAFGYSWDGKYMIDKKTGEKKTFEDVVNQSKQAYGGYLKMNKIGRK